MYIIQLPVVYFFELFWLQSAYVTRSFTSYVILKTNPGFKGLSFTFHFSFIPVIIKNHDWGPHLQLPPNTGEDHSYILAVVYDATIGGISVLQNT